MPRKLLPLLLVLALTNNVKADDKTKNPQPQIKNPKQDSKQQQNQPQPQPQPQQNQPQPQATPEPEPPRPAPQTSWEIEPRGRPGKNIMFVVDTSGSMKGPQLSDAINTVMEIANHPFDELQIAIVSYGTNTHRWPGFEDRNPQDGSLMSRNRWAISAPDNMQLAHTWLNSNIDGHGTNTVSALHHAFTSCSGGQGNESVDDLTIIIISDGAFSDFNAIGTKIREMQQVRQRAGLHAASIGFVGIDPSTAHNLGIKTLLGREVERDGQKVWEPALGDLGYYRLTYPVTEDDDILLPPPPMPMPLPLPPTPGVR